MPKETKLYEQYEKRIKKMKSTLEREYEDKCDLKYCEIELELRDYKDRLENNIKPITDFDKYYEQIWTINGTINNIVMYNTDVNNEDEAVMEKIILEN